MKVLLKYGCFYRTDATGKGRMYEQGETLFVNDKEAKALGNKIVILEKDLEGAPVAPVPQPAPVLENKAKVIQESPPAIQPPVSIPPMPEKDSVKLEILAPPPPVLEKKKAPMKPEPVPVLPDTTFEAHVPEVSSAVSKAANAPMTRSKVQDKAEKAVKTVSKAAKAKLDVTKAESTVPKSKKSRFKRSGK